MILDLHVPGEPVPQGSKTVLRGRAVEGNAARLRPWRATVTAAAMAALPDGWDTEGCFQVVLRFHFARPKRHYAASGLLKGAAPPNWHGQRPDVDKLARAVLDALTDAGVWRDDAQVSSLIAQKVWVTGPPRMHVLAHHQ